MASYNLIGKGSKKGVMAQRRNGSTVFVSGFWFCSAFAFVCLDTFFCFAFTPLSL
jgi:hypothetical protein